MCSTEEVKRIKLLQVFLLLICTFASSCITTKIDGNSNSSSKSVLNVPVTPADMHFTAENLVYMLQQTYYNFDVAVPQAAIDSIRNAPNDAAAMVAYKTAIDQFLDSRSMSSNLKIVGRQMLGMVNGLDPTTRYPENLFAYVITQGLPMNEFLLATYAIDDNGQKISADYKDNTNTNIISPPDSAKAGYLTYEKYIFQYLTPFAMRMDREIIGINLCDVAPYSKFESFSWEIEQINNKYRISEDGTSCFSCHAKKNPLRGAWQAYNINSRAYAATRVQGQNQYAQEAAGTGGSTLEPRIPGGSNPPMAVSEAEATMYKFKENGSAVLTPRALAQEVIKEPRFGRCWTERLLAITLNLPQGHSGQGFTPPDNFSGSDEQIAFLDKWTDKFNEENQIPLEWMRVFLKDPDYLALSYKDKE